MTAPLCFIDTETTGVHPEREIWEVGMIRRDDNGEVERQFFVEVDLDKADPFGLNVGRFYERHPGGRHLAGSIEDPDWETMLDYGAGMTRRGAAVEIARYTHEAHLIGAVPNFDTESFDRLLRAYGLLPGWHYHLIDVEALAVGFLLGLNALDTVPNTDGPEHGLPWKSNDLSRACGVEPPSDDERHTALGDARWAMRLYDAITGGPDA